MVSDDPNAIWGLTLESFGQRGRPSVSFAFGQRGWPSQLDAALMMIS